ncbi:fimbrial biogenesis chaperone [Vibrio sp. McD22-P3]|uniref:fimbrial biogenesis chaperone n=1 Tax=Vibrio sp. McD22-P3 TaxID=2724880 RepID=UPI001F2B3B5C|nr:fimbria/pilus periplasmic chaperone [Vibrio sp. McD22-P3]MCF4175334.1 fimbria/pilus periplasmic chaperone [Vibrio sp. McD22-P3]
MKKYILLMLMLPSICYAIAIPGARVVYIEGSKYFQGEIVNNSESATLVQLSILDDNFDEEKLPIITPNIILSKADSRSGFRIYNLESVMDSNEVETYRTLSAVSIKEQSDTPSDVIASLDMHYKLFIRPKSIATVTMADAVKKLVINKQGDDFTVRNESPLHITLISIEQRKEETMVVQMIAPYQEITFTKSSNFNPKRSFELNYIDDIGLLAKDKRLL